MLEDKLDMPKAKILLVDEDVLDADVVRCVDSRGLRGFSANGVQDALLLLDAHNIDLLIGEINLAKIDGIGFLEQLRQAISGKQL